MDLALIGKAPLAVQVHLATVLPAFAIGTWLIFFSTKGDRSHRGLGALYLALMFITAMAVMFIRPYTFIHLFVPLTLSGIFGAIWYARRGNVRGHRSAMIGMYVGGILLAGALAGALPGRLLYRVFAGG